MFQEIITRAEARERGFKYYFTGKQCKQGHIAKRFVPNGTCTDCRKSKDNTYRQKNAEKLRERKSKYYQKKSENIRAKVAKYRQENAEKVRENGKNCYKLRMDRLLENDPELYRKKVEEKRAYRERFRAENPDYDVRYKQENRDKVLAINAKRRSAKRQRLPSWFGEIDQFAMTEAADLAKRRESITGQEWHVDHMIPLMARKASGLHCASNLQVIPATLNLQKNNKMIFTEPGEWIKAL